MPRDNDTPRELVPACCWGCEKRLSVGSAAREMYRCQALLVMRQDCWIAARGLLSAERRGWVSATVTKG